MKSFSLYEHCVMLPYDNKIKENSLPFSCGDFIKNWFRHEDNKTGCRFLIVDAYNNPRTLKFYENNNFKYLYRTEEEEELYFKTTMTRMMYFDLKK